MNEKHPTPGIEHPRPASEPGHGSLPRRIYRFYRDGFKSMTVGRDLWILILIKLFILFFVFKLLFFPNLLERDYSTDSERSQAVRSSMIDRSR